MRDDELEERIRLFVAEQVGYDAARITAATDVVGASKIDGADIDDLVIAFGREFDVDVSDFRWYHHGGPEGCNPLWLLFKPWWARKTYVPMLLSDLVESARQHRWSITYPENEREG